MITFILISLFIFDFAYMIYFFVLASYYGGKYRKEKIDEASTFSEKIIAHVFSAEKMFLDSDYRGESRKLSYFYFAMALLGIPMGLIIVLLSRIFTQ